MAVEYDANGTPILTNDSLISDVPPYTQALAAASIMPVGAIMPYMGTAAPNYWLFCDGRSYDTAYFDVLSGVNADFHSDGTFRVPDLRGRSPIGTNPNGSQETWGSDSEPVTKVLLGGRLGDWRVQNHDHRIQGSAWSSNFVAGHTTNRQDGTGLHTIEWNGNPGADTSHPLYAQTRPSDPGYGGWPGIPLEGQGRNLSPATGVNFIVYTGKPTLDTNGDILAECGQGAEIAPVTTRMMIEARLAEAGIGEEEVKMLKEQLAELKESHAE